MSHAHAHIQMQAHSHTNKYIIMQLDLYHALAITLLTLDGQVRVKKWMLWHTYNTTFYPSFTHSSLLLQFFGENLALHRPVYFLSSACTDAHHHQSRVARPYIWTGKGSGERQDL